MKNIKYYMMAVSLAFTMTACDDFLDLRPQGAENSENFFNTSQNGIYAVNGAYDMLQFDEGSGPDGQWMAHHHDFFIGDLISDDAEKGSTDGDLNQLFQLIGGTANAGHSNAEVFWLHGYWGISRANFALEGLQTATWDAELRDRLIGESLFLRAYFHWYLVRMFGPIPVFTASVKPSEFGKVNRAPLSEVYAQIAIDLTRAAELLPERSQYSADDAGRATKGAAKALLARVYMYQIGTDRYNTTVTWEEVYNLTSDVINSREYKLLSNYAELHETENKNSTEGVFEIQFSQSTTEEAPGSIGTNFFNFQGNRADDSGWGFNNPSASLYDAFEDGDPRLSCTVYGENFNNGIPYGSVKKYKRAEQGSDWLNRKATLATKPALAKAADRNIKVIRYADVILMNAEAAYYTGRTEEAINQVNVIRERARNSSYCKGYSDGKNSFDSRPESPAKILPALSGLNGQDLLDAIWQERRVELAMEQLRFFDLVRTGRFLDAMENEKETERAAGGKYEEMYSASVNDIFKGIKGKLASKCIEGPNGNQVYVLPIPLAEVQSWGLEQNPGY